MRSKFASSWLRNHAAPSSVESTCSQNAFEPGEEEVGGAARGDEVALLGGGIGGSGRMLSNRRIVGVELDDGVTPLTICSARAAADTVLPVERVREVSDAGERRITPSSEVSTDGFRAAVDVVITRRPIEAVGASGERAITRAISSARLSSGP